MNVIDYAVKAFNFKLCARLRNVCELFPWLKLSVLRQKITQKCLWRNVWSFSNSQQIFKNCPLWTLDSWTLNWILEVNFLDLKEVLIEPKMGSNKLSQSLDSIWSPQGTSFQKKKKLNENEQSIVLIHLYGATQYFNVKTNKKNKNNSDLKKWIISS